MYGQQPSFRCWLFPLLTEADLPGRISICPLYKLNLTIGKNTALCIRYLLPPANNTQKADEFGIYIDLSSNGVSPNRLRKYLVFQTRREGEWCDLTIRSLRAILQRRGSIGEFQIVELGIYFKQTHRAEDHALEDTGITVDHSHTTESKQPFVYLGEILISGHTPPLYKISSLTTNIDPMGRTRLSWKIAPEDGVSPREAPAPFSEVTGPFAYFLVYFDGELQGVAHTLEYILSKSFIGHSELGLGYHVQGVMWNGEIIASS